MMNYHCFIHSLKIKSLESVVLLNFRLGKPAEGEQEDKVSTYVFVIFNFFVLIVHSPIINAK
jgi:hypothetical protein